MILVIDALDNARAVEAQDSEGREALYKKTLLSIGQSEESGRLKQQLLELFGSQNFSLKVNLL